ncbi:kelch-like protein 20 [Hydractinia symbiolongicarpus]|uniref:kelch-like protein 20 n=1 Tax=Hydractinia symbiolongicarpus TaxID=13093 RepID=UPI00254C2DDE|nr:kelch-like protein 20 [Hydractinia symbiolongicarpus]
MGVQRRIFQKFHFSKECFEVMNELRKEKKLCDVILKVNKREFNAHRIILAGVSPYLRAMFTNGMLETLQNVIEIHGIDEKTMEMLIDFSYSGKIEINIENVQQMLAGSTLLNIDSLSLACTKFLRNQLDSANCIGIKEFAKIYFCRDLEEHATEYLHQNFLDVINHEEFLKLSSTELLELLTSDKIQVRSEEDVFSALENWLYHDFQNRTQYVPDILKCIRVPLLSLEFLQCKVFSANFIKSNTQCQLILARVMNEHPEKLPAYLCTPRAVPQSIYAIGGRNSLYCQLDSVERYDIFQDCWHIEKSMNIARTAVAAATMNGCLYAIAGERAVNEPHDNTLYLPYVECYNPILQHWFPIADLSTPRSFVSVVVCNGKLYALGGEDRNSSYNIVERYSRKKNCWKRLKPMKKRRAGAGVTEHDGCIYIAGGYDRTVHCDRASVECYCPEKDEWTFVAELEKARSGLSLVSLDNYIYAIGGRNRGSDHYFNVCERYNPSTMQWVSISSMISPRAWSGIGILRNKIFVVGGFDGFSRLNKVEVYDVDADEWKEVANMNFARAGCGAAVT